MDYLFGLKTKDFVLLAADKSVFQQIYRLKSDANKSCQVGDKVLMLCVGEGGDADQFAEYIEKNVQLYKMRNGYELSPTAIATYTRRALAESLRSQTPYLVHLIMGGYDEHEGPYLTFMDYLATQFEGDYLMHGYDFTETEAIEALKICLREVRTRFLLNMPSFKAWIIDKNGIKHLEDITV